jgi:lactoylglutathione lyase
MACVVINGLFETHLTVADLDASIAFYRDLVGLELAHLTHEGNAAFFWIGAPGQSMLGLWETGSSPLTMRLHVAFTSTVDDILSAHARLRAAGVTPRGFRGEPVEEPVVIGWMPAISIYFTDPDGNLLEYLAMLPESPSPDAGIVPHSKWRNA